MIVGFIQDSSKYFDTDTQRKFLISYANERNLKDFNIINIAESEGILSQQMKAGDTLVMPCISLLGDTFENILSSIKQLTERRVYIYSAKENLSIDTYNQSILANSLDVCVSVYKGILSLKNSKVQQDLLKQGKSRGCLHNARKGKYILTEREDEVRKCIEEGCSNAEIARRLGCAPGNVFYFLKYLGLKNPNNKRFGHVEHKLEQVKEEVITCLNSGMPISQIARQFGVCYATARDFVKKLGFRTKNGGVHA